MNELKVTIQVGGSVAVIVVPDSPVRLSPNNIQKYQELLVDLCNKMGN